MKKSNMENLLKNRIISLHKDFLELVEISKNKNEELQKQKKDLYTKTNLEESIKDFSNLATDFTLISRDSQIIFTELFNYIKLYKELNFEALPEDVIEFYNKNEVFFPKTLFVVKEGGIVEKEEGSLERERDKFLKSDYLKNLINLKG